MHVFKRVNNSVMAVQFTPWSRGKLCDILPHNITTLRQTEDILVLYEPVDKAAYVVNLFDWIVRDDTSMKVVPNKEFMKKYHVVLNIEPAKETGEQETSQEAKEN